VTVTGRILAVAAKEGRQVLRDRATIGMLLGIPLLQLLLFGFAIQLVPRSLTVSVVSEQLDTANRLIQRLQRAGVAAEVLRSPNLAAALLQLRRGESVIVVDPSHHPLTAYIDGSDPVLAQHAQSEIDRFIRQLALPADMAAELPAVRTRVLFNPEARTQPYLVSGLLGLILTMTLVMMSALSLARERERGSMEGLLVLRVRPVELCLGKLAPYLLLGYVQGLALLLAAWLFFGVAVRGSIWVLVAAIGIFASANLLLGFLFSTLARVQMQAMQMTFFFWVFVISYG
jgi:ABC-2 type transport system permease protein